jgi:hypothetical protein
MRSPARAARPGLVVAAGAVVLAGWLSLAARAAEAGPYAFLGQAGASAVALTADGDTVYVSYGSVLTTWRLDGSGGLRPIGRGPVQQDVLRELAADGPVVYALGGDQWTSTRLYRFDVSEAARPVLAARVDLPMAVSYTQLAVAQPALWLLEGGALRTVDTGMPIGLRPAGRLVDGIRFRAVADGWLAATLDSSGGLDLVVGRDPDAPERLGRFEGGVDDWDRRVLADVALAGRYAYLAGGNLPTPAPTPTTAYATPSIGPTPTRPRATRTPRTWQTATPAPYFRVLDVSEPARAREVGALRDGSAVARALRFRAGFGYLAMNGADELRVVDARTPEAPRLRGRLPVDGGSPVIAGDHLLYRRSRSAVEVVTVADPDQPRSLGERALAPGLPWLVTGAAVAGNRLAVADRDRGVHLLELREDGFGGPMGFLAAPGVLAVAWAGAASGSYPLLWLDGDGLAVAEVADLPSPRLISRLPFDVAPPDQAFYNRGIAASGGYAWLATGPRGLMTVDLSELAAPRQVAAPIHPGEPQPDSAFAAALDGTSLFVIGARPRLYRFDVRDPERPRELPWLALPWPASWVVVHDGYAFLTGRTGEQAGLVVVDARSAQAPSIIGQVNFAWPGGGSPVLVAPPGLAVADGQVFIAGTRLQPVDVSDPTMPRLLAPQILPHLDRGFGIHPAPAVLAWSDRLLVADDGDAGVTLLRRRDAPATQIATTSPTASRTASPPTTSTPTPPVAPTTTAAGPAPPAGDRLWLPRLWSGSGQALRAVGHSVARLLR